MDAAYHHFGMISPFKVARDLVRNSSNGSKKFFDEFMTWRELSYAFCFQHWPDLESMQVSVQCLHLFLLALLLSAMGLHLQQAWHTCSHLLSQHSLVTQMLACSHLEHVSLGSRHTDMCIVLLSQDAALSQIGTRQQRVLHPLHVSSQTLQYEALLEHHCINLQYRPRQVPLL